MPIRILEKDPVKMRDKSSKAKWITKKPKSWITKKPKKMEDKETTSKWITKKSEPKWITKKGHKREMDLGGTGKKNWITKKTKPRAGFQGGGRVGAAKRGFNKKILRKD